jgi:hypothetical protein
MWRNMQVRKELLDNRFGHMQARYGTTDQLVTLDTLLYTTIIQDCRDLSEVRAEDVCDSLQNYVFLQTGLNVFDFTVLLSQNTIPRRR